MPLMFKELTRLFDSPTRTKLLKFFLFQPDMRTSAANAGAAVGVPKAVAEKEVRSLVRFGFLVARKQKRKMLFTVNRAHPLVPALRTFLEVSTLPDDRSILQAFRGVPGVSLIVASGALAREDRSSVDFLIVAKKTKNPLIAKAVTKVERMAGMPLRYVVMEPQIYAARSEARDRLLRDVFEFKNRLILGHSA